MEANQRRARTIRSFIIVITVAITAILIPATVGGAPTAQAGELDAEAVFSASNLTFTQSDGNGTLAAQVNWSGPGKLMQWSFRPSPPLRAIATSPMTCVAGHMNKPEYHGHPHRGS